MNLSIEILIPVNRHIEISIYYHIEIISSWGFIIMPKMVFSGIMTGRAFHISVPGVLRSWRTGRSSALRTLPRFQDFSLKFEQRGDILLQRAEFWGILRLKPALDTMGAEVTLSGILCRAKVPLS